MTTRSSVAARIRITRTGKIMRRKMAQGHFRAGKSQKQIRNKRGALVVGSADNKNIKQFLTGSHRGH